MTGSPGTSGVGESTKDPDRARLARLLFAAFATLYLATVSGHYGGDGFHSYLTAESLVLDGDLAILDRPFGIEEMSRGARLTAPAGTGGRHYSQYGLALPALEAPLYAIGRLIARGAPSIPPDYVTMGVVSTLNALLTAAIVALLFVAARRYGSRGRFSLLAPFAFGIGSFAWGNSRLGFAEPLLALSLLAAFLLIEREREASAERGRSLLLAGAALGLAIQAKVYAVILVPIISVAAWTAVPRGPARRRAFLLFALPVAFALVALAVANSARFGNPLRTGYEIGAGEGAGDRFDPGTRTPGRILGLLVSPGKGILLYAPVVALALLLFGRFGRARPRAGAWFIALLGTHLLFYGSHTVWHGMSGWGPRYLLPITPFLLLPLADPAVISAASRRFAWLLVAAGALIEIPVLLVNLSRHIETFGERGMRFWSFADSPIPGNWKALLSAAAGRGEWDVWFLTIPAIRPSPATTLACAGALFGLLLLAALLFQRLWRELLTEDRRRMTS